MTWRLIVDKNIKYFQFKWQNCVFIYSIKYSEDKINKIFAPVFLRQIHSDIIIDLDSKKKLIGDGLISKKRTLALGVRIADCLPVYFYTKDKIGIIHCGWRGIIKGIAKKAATIMGDYRYLLGASIGPCCYEVKKDVAALFKQKYNHALVLKKDRYFVDLKAAVMQDLGEKNLLGTLNLCTRCQPEYFFSHRRGDRKRNYALIQTF